MSSCGRYKMMYDKFMCAIPHDILKYANGQIQLRLPVLQIDLFMELLTESAQMFRNEPTMLELHSPCVIVGDIHGHVLDLFRILNIYGPPSHKRYIFLGDIVDRGEFSIEALAIVLLMKVLWPGNVYIIRGNHEFAFMCQQCGFYTQLNSVYSDERLFEACLNTFAVMPIAARIDQKMLCVHGGIGPGITNLNSIRALQRPIEDFGDDNLDSLLWSDPSDDDPLFVPSTRGSGYFFGCEAVKKFIEKNGIELIIRAHECVMNGFEYHFDQKLITVFSASNYCGLVGNDAAVLDVSGPMKYTTKRLSPLQYLKRRLCAFDLDKPKQVKQVDNRKLSKVAQSWTTRDLPTLKESLSSFPSASRFKPSTFANDAPVILHPQPQKESSSRAPTSNKRRRSSYY